MLQRPSCTTPPAGGRTAATATMDVKKLWRLPLLSLGHNLSEAAEMAAVVEEIFPDLQVEHFERWVARVRGPAGHADGGSQGCRW